MDPQRRRPLTSLRVLLALVVALAATVLSGRAHLLEVPGKLWALPLALLLGHLAFAQCILLARRNVREAWVATRTSLRLVYRPYAGRTMLFYLQVAVAEELLFRALPLDLLGGRLWALLPLAGVFALLHVWRPRRGLPLLQLLDLALLGLWLGLLFLWLRQLWPLVLVHWLRNVSVAKTMVRRHIVDAARAAEAGQAGAESGAPPRQPSP